MDSMMAREKMVAVVPLSCQLIFKVEAVSR